MTLHLGVTPWQLNAPSATSIGEQAAFAETQGYESFWLPENHFGEGALPDPLMLLASAATTTTTIKLATTSYLLTLRNPLQPQNRSPCWINSAVVAYCWALGAVMPRKCCAPFMYLWLRNVVFLPGPWA